MTGFFYCYSYRHPLFSALIYLQLSPLQDPVSGDLSNTWGSGSSCRRSSFPAPLLLLPFLRRCLSSLGCPAALPESHGFVKVFRTHLEIDTERKAGGSGDGVTF